MGGGERRKWIRRVDSHLSDQSSVVESVPLNEERDTKSVQLVDRGRECDQRKERRGTYSVEGRRRGGHSVGGVRELNIVRSVVDVNRELSIGCLKEGESAKEVRFRRWTKGREEIATLKLTERVVGSVQDGSLSTRSSLHSGIEKILSGSLELSGGLEETAKERNGSRRSE